MSKETVGQMVSRQLGVTRRIQIADAAEVYVELRELRRETSKEMRKCECPCGVVDDGDARTNSCRSYPLVEYARCPECMAYKRLECQRADLGREIAKAWKNLKKAVEK